MTPDEASQRAERAKQILDDELVNETFNETHEALLRAIKAAKTESEAFKATIAIQVFDLLKNQFISHIETAKVIEFNFRDERKKFMGII